MTEQERALLIRSTSFGGPVRGARMHPIEANIIEAVQWLRLIVETIGALIVGIGVLAAGLTWLKALFMRTQTSFNSVRISFARYLALALEFQLGADILSTAISPSWDQIGKLGAIAVIRTALNYFLTMELREGAAEDKPDAQETPVSSRGI